ncbi:MAG: molybdopterin-synthase adenylyltransferase MoeB [Succinivibrio sp.]|nr:molybdopterin-synthase adenylyltransferase MoeB [Succinivibrio sp.]
MSVTVILPTTLRNFTAKESECTVEAGSVQEALEALVALYPEAGPIIFDEQGKIRSFLNIFVNSDNVRYAEGTATPLHDNDTLTIIPAIAGGSGEGEARTDEEGAGSAPSEDKPQALIPPERAVKLDNDEVLRYSRHLLLQEIGIKGQKKLKGARVLVAGAGGLGAPLCLYLAAAGVGTIGIADFDLVDATNLQRQVIHGQRDIGRPKTASARDSIRAINPKIKVEVFEGLNADNIEEIVSSFDVVADGTDNYVARYLISDACVKTHKPDVFGAIYQFEGQVTVFYPPYSPCYRCLYPAPPPPGLVPTCSQSGVLGAIAGIIGSIQANEVIKLLVGGGEPLLGKLLTMDIWHNRFNVLNIPRDPHCVTCANPESLGPLTEIDYEDLCGLKQEAQEEPVESIEALELKRRLDAGESITVVDVREPHERAIVKFPGAVVIPIGQLSRRQNELDPTCDTVFICKEGQRSILAIRTLREAGYTGRCFNLKDGINTWARDVDRSLPQY